MVVCPRRLLSKRSPTQQAQPKATTIEFHIQFEIIWRSSLWVLKTPTILKIKPSKRMVQAHLRYRLMELAAMYRPRRVRTCHIHLTATTPEMANTTNKWALSKTTPIKVTELVTSNIPMDKRVQLCRITTRQAPYRMLPKRRATDHWHN